MNTSAGQITCSLCKQQYVWGAFHACFYEVNGQMVQVPIAAIVAENQTEDKVVSDPEFKLGIGWGVPRPGHPEGSVRKHVIEILNAVDDSPNRKQLRLIALIHDTFKYKVDYTKPRSGENHHATIARRFAEKYITDEVVLDVIELHDEAHNAYTMGLRSGQWNQANKRAQKLVTKLGNNLPLYLEFFWADSGTKGNERKSYDWFARFWEP